MLQMFVCDFIKHILPTVLDPVSLCGPRRGGGVGCWPLDNQLVRAFIRVNFARLQLPGGGPFDVREQILWTQKCPVTRMSGRNPERGVGLALFAEGKSDTRRMRNNIHTQTYTHIKFCFPGPHNPANSLLLLILLLLLLFFFSLPLLCYASKQSKQ